MVGIRGLLEIIQVATHAGGLAQRVVVVDMAICALPRRHCVHARQSEAGVAVVEGRIRPVVGVVALLAGLRETCGDVIGIRRTLEVRQVATHACRGANRVVIVDVAIRALPRWHRVHPR